MELDKIRIGHRRDQRHRQSDRRGLAQLGMTVVLVGRDAAKGKTVFDEIAAKTGNRKLDFLVADLSSQAEIRRLAEAFRSKYDRLHVLVNNAGGIFPIRRLTADGLEQTFAVNHLAYFLLTNLLLDLLKDSAPARVVNVSSGAQGFGKILLMICTGSSATAARRLTANPSWLTWRSPMRWRAGLKAAA